MARLVQKRSRKTGLPPGTAVHIGEKKANARAFSCCITMPRK